MQVNIFSGGRRIAAVLGTLLAAAAGGFAWIVSEPYVGPTYAVAINGDTWPTDSCAYGLDGTETASVVTAAGRSVTVSLCFKAQLASDGRTLVPYKSADGQVWMNDRYAPAVTDYMSKFASRFTLSAERGQDVDEQWKRAEWDQYRNTILAAAGALVAAWIIATTLGWIVRGFLGVPRGQDFRPSAPPISIAHQPSERFQQPD